MENLSSVLTAIWGWISTGLTTITGSPILLIGLGIFVAGAVIGLVYRLAFLSSSAFLFSSLALFLASFSALSSLLKKFMKPMFSDLLFPIFLEKDL